MIGAFKGDDDNDEMVADEVLRVEGNPCARCGSTVYHRKGILDGAHFWTSFSFPTISLFSQVDVSRSILISLPSSKAL